MSSIPSASEGLGQGAGLLGGYVSSNYQNYLGNTIRQVLAGNQFLNVFGTGLNSYLDIARIWQDCDYTTMPFSFKDTPTSTAWSKWNDRLGYLGIDLGVIAQETDKTTGKKQWAGWTSLNLGDLSSLHYKGNSVTVSRSVCQITYATKVNLPLQWTLVEAKVKSFFWWIWGVGIASMVVFRLYNTKVAQNQEVQEKIEGNMTWTMINIALELVQFLVLKKMASYQQEWTASIMELEIQESVALKLDDSEIVVTMDRLKALEKDLLGKVNDAANEVGRLQKLSGAAVQTISKAANDSALALAKTQAAQNAQFAALVKANRQAMYEALVSGGVAPAVAEVQLAEFTELSVKAKEEADLSEKSLQETQEAIDREQVEQPPIANISIPSTNSDTVGSNASAGAALNPSLSDNIESALQSSTAVSQDIQLRSDQARALANRVSIAVDNFTKSGETRNSEVEDDINVLRDSMVAQDDGDAGISSIWGKFKRKVLYGDSTKKRSYGPTLFSWSKSS
jgi:hypothetical protein